MARLFEVVKESATSPRRAHRLVFQFGGQATTALVLAALIFVGWLFTGNDAVLRVIYFLLMFAGVAGAIALVAVAAARRRRRDG